MKKFLFFWLILFCVEKTLAQAPIITSVSPVSGHIGSVVTIMGANFTGVKTVSFGGVPAKSFYVVSTTGMLAIVDSGATGNVTVKTPVGAANFAGFNFVAAPTVSLPANQFLVTVTDASCKGNSDGIINITGAHGFSYTATITGNGLTTSYTFTGSTQINNLKAGRFNVCITATSQPGFHECLTTVIAEPKELSVYTTVAPSGDELVINMNGGSNYKIVLNGTLYVTSESQITLPLNKGNNKIAVSTDNACQGTVVKNINLSPEMLVYPNPFSNIINLSLGKDNLKSATISVISTSDGKPIYTNIFNNVSGTMQIDLTGIKSGYYLLRVSGDNLEKVFKILKN